jgi:cobalt-precorrin 5A hydrolase
MASEEAMIVAGIGCRRGTLSQDIVSLILAALGNLDIAQDRVQALKGVPSIAEASALVAAGHNARLLGARVAAEKATCAIAISEGS